MAEGRMTKIKTFVHFIIVIMTTIAFAVSASAEQMLVDVAPVFPKNQDPEVKNYVSLHVNESHFKQEIEFIVSNRSKEEVTIQIEALNALNSPQKGIQYTKNTEESNTRLLDNRYALANYIEVNEQVTLKGRETKRIQAKIDIPELDGTILGAIGFKTLNKAEETNDEQLMIHNELNRVIGVQINAENSELAEFVVHDPYVEPMPAYYIIRLPIELNSSLLMKDVLLEYEVFDDKGNLLFESKEEPSFNIAPHTQTAFALPWQHDTLEENKEYVIKGELNYGNESLTFNKTFDFNEARALKQGKGNSIGKPEIITDMSLYVWLTLALLFILGGGAIVYFRNRKKQSDETTL